MIYQRESLGLTYEEITNNLGVDRSTVWRTVHLSLFHQTGDIAKKYDSTNLSRKLTDVVQCTLLLLILERPGIYLREPQTEVKLVTGLDIAACTICQFFDSHGFS